MFGSSKKVDELTKKAEALEATVKNLKEKAEHDANKKFRALVNEKLKKFCPVCGEIANQIREEKEFGFAHYVIHQWPTCKHKHVYKGHQKLNADGKVMAYIEYALGEI